MPSYTVSGRVVDADGAPVASATVTVLEIVDLTGAPRTKGSATLTNSEGEYSVSWAESVAPMSPWDLFVEATDGVTTVDSPLIPDLEDTATVDLVLAAASTPYAGRSEWDRIAAKLAPLMGATLAKDIPVDRIEWLARRADVFPTHLGFYIQAHRLADQRTVAPETCYACLRAGLPAALPELLRVGPRAWEDALRHAWLRRILALPGDGSAAALDTEAAAQVAALQELVVEAATAVPPGGVTTQRTLFDTASIDPSDQQTFMETWVARTGTLAEFWQTELPGALSGDVPAKVETFQFTIQAATLVGGDVAALTGLQSERGSANISTVRDLAAWSESDWDTFLVNHSVTAPTDMPGTDATAQRQNYARALSRIVEDSYPSAWLRHAIARDEGAQSAPANTAHLATFLTQNPDFDITRSTVSHYLDGAATPWQGIDPADEAEARANLELTQRVYRLTPRIGRYTSTKVLLDNGISSATDVVGYTREEFTGRFGPLLPSDDHDSDELARSIWDRATRIHSTAIGLASQLALGRSGADFMPLAIGGSAQFDGADHGLAELSTILGSLDYCACEHCRSVFSPAAYLTDLLAFLAKRPAKLATDAFALLSARRPDIRHILLDCTNTNTPLPYIDLVNELLEAKFAGELVMPGSSHQTTWTADELRVHPEHLDHEVYDGAKPISSPITGLVYPWNLPFSLAELEARTYLEHLSVPRAELLARFEPNSPDNSYEHPLAAARLGLNASEFEIVSGAFTGNASTDDREYWGYVDGVDNDWVARLNGMAAGSLGDIGELLRRGRYTLDELRATLALDFVDPSGVVTFVWDESCDLADARIPALNASILDRLHRFTRLQRRCGIPPRMLNVLLVDVCGETLDAAALVSLGQIIELERDLDLAWDELATFWSGLIDARSYDSGAKSLFERRFLSKEFETIGANVLDGFQPNGTTLAGELDPAQAMSAEQRAVVVAAIGVSADELGLLTAPDSPLASDDFSLANLSALYRAAGLARALRLSIEQLLTLVTLTGSDPFTSPAATADFIALVAGVRASGWTVAELDWVLRHEGDGPLDEAQTGRELAELARGLATIVDESSQLEDPDGAALTTNLGQLLTPTLVTTTLEIVDLSTGLDAAAQQTHLNDELGAYLDASAAYDVLVDDQSATYEVELPRRRAWLLAQIVSYQRRRALVVDTLASRFEIDAELANQLAFSILSTPTAVADILMAPFADEDAITAGLTSGTHPNQFDAWTRAAKAALVAAHHGLRADEAQWYSGNGSWLDLDALPLSDADPDASFDAWNKLRRALELRSLFRRGELAHAQIAAAATLAAATQILADHTGWDADMLESTVTALGYGLADFGQEVLLERLRVVATTAERLGTDLDTAHAWATTTPTMAQAAAIKTVARAKYDAARWQKVAAPLRDQIRERQRDALVDAVLATDASLADPNAVFEHLLVDVEMSACMMSSRIKQAISSVQIFIHRALLHLELDELTFDADAISRWEWMKNYRVWEANRKVFLYPENWIEPELRANKTPEFEALEATLMQGVLDQSRVEKALVSYLDQLDRVSNLEIMGVYQRQVGGELWLLGRTAAKPHEWFLRRCSAGGAWDPWEEVPAKIETDTVALIVRERRVHLFWADRYETSSGDDARAWNFRISHVERSEDGWSKITVSEASSARTLDFLSSRLFLRVKPDDRIEVHILGIIPGDLLYLAEYFEYDTREQLSLYMGQTYMQGEHIGLWDATRAYLKSWALVGIQEGHRFIGPRHINPQYENLEAASFDGEYDLAAGTRFEQGDFSDELFGSRSSVGSPAMVHHADLWTPDPTMKFLPVVYDDRQRKYLLSPLPHYDHASDEGDDIELDMLGNFPAEAYWLCPPEDTATGRPEAVAPTSRVQRLRDGVGETKTWSQGVPGQVEGLDQFGYNDQAAPLSEGAALLSKAQETAQATTSPVGGVTNGYPSSPTAFKLGIEALYHPASRLMVEAVAKQGLRGLFPQSPTSPLFRQQISNDPFTDDQLDLNYDIVDGPPPIEEFDFRFDSPYGLYNWELFFHVPMLMAAKLTAEQRFDEAQRWHHLVFNPIEVIDDPQESPTSRFWRLKPFVEQAEALTKDQLEAMLGIGVTQAEQSAATAKFNAQVKTWEQNPFDPHAVARIRPGVYQRTLLRKYIDNLIAWADNLFGRDTVESINEATILYVLVAQLLGPRPQAVPANESPAQSFEDLSNAGLDAFSNAIVQLENYVLMPSDSVLKLGCGPSEERDPWVRVPVISRFWYFCYPPNAQLLKYWDTVEDRLWKIRHCRNIEGIERQLPLFQPPIDPALLVRATAAGVDIQSVLAELASGLPPYRFRSVQARATAFTASLRNLGGELLSAIEKRDAEQLSRIRAGHELQLLDSVREVRVQQVEEATQALASLGAARATAEDRRSHYAGLLAGKTSLSEREERHFELAKKGNRAKQAASTQAMLGSILAAIPNLTISMLPEVDFGGLHLSGVSNAITTGMNLSASEYDFHANKASMTAGFNRRAEDWELQRSQAQRELARIDQDILAAEIRREIAKQELRNHDLQTEQSRELDRYMRGKFSNRELYDWMVAQLSTLYFQTYQLAFDLAKRAERAYRHELAIPTDQAPIIKYGYWDSLRKGLLAGARLNHDLERLELAYMDRDVREFELRKNISLAQLSPAALQSLQETGTCDFTIPEVLFDLDHPGHYLRRIRSISLTIPAVVGPYTTLGARLVLNSHQTAPTPGADQLEEPVTSTERIATSTAMNDSGLFQLDFRDERYLPFEYAGAVSSWTLELPETVRQFDYRTISDVVISMAYTARDGGDTARTAVEGQLVADLNTALAGGATQLVVVHDAFPNEWEAFFQPGEADQAQTLTLPLDPELLPYFARAQGLAIDKVELAILLEPGASVTSAGTVSLDVGTSQPPVVFAMGTGNYLIGSTATLNPTEQPDTWTLSRTRSDPADSNQLDDPEGWLDRTKIAGMLLMLHYQLS